MKKKPLKTLKFDCLDLDTGELVRISNIMYGLNGEAETVSIFHANGKQEIRFQGEDLSIMIA